MAEIFSKVANVPSSTETLCSRCKEIVSVTGVAITLMTQTNTACLCASDEHVASMEDLQFTLGEGPSRDAFATGHPILEGHLAQALPVRWPALTSLVLGAGFEALFAFPLQIGAASIGTLSLYQRSASSLSSIQHADAVIAADVLTHVILSLQAHAPAGTLAVALKDAGSYRAEIHQASGMLSEQLHVSVAEALVRLRSHAYATCRPIAELSSAVVARRLRLDRHVRRGALEVKWIEEM